MALRDYFAAKALAALIDVEDRNRDPNFLQPTNYESITREAYTYADAMMTARTHKPAT